MASVGTTLMCPAHYKGVLILRSIDFVYICEVAVRGKYFTSHNKKLTTTVSSLHNGMLQIWQHCYKYSPLPAEV